MPLKYTDRLFVHLLNQVGHAVSADFVRVLRERGFTVRQWRVLGSLWDEKSLTLTELAEVSFCGHSTVTRVIERLQDQGLIVRRSDAIDRRRAHVSLTPGGRRRIRDLVEMSESMEKAIVEGVGTDRVARIMAELREMLVQLEEDRQGDRRLSG